MAGALRVQHHVELVFDLVEARDNFVTARTEMRIARVLMLVSIAKSRHPNIRARSQLQTMDAARTELAGMEELPSGHDHLHRVSQQHRGASHHGGLRGHPYLLSELSPRRWR